MTSASTTRISVERGVAAAVVLGFSALGTRHSALGASAVLGGDSLRLEVRPSALTLQVGDTARVTARVVNPLGAPVETRSLTFFSNANLSLEVDPSGHVLAVRPGQYRVMVVAMAGGATLRGQVPVSVPAPPISAVELAADAHQLLVGGSLRLRARVIDRLGVERADVPVRWATGEPRIASIDRQGYLTAHREGSVTVVASAGGVEVQRRYMAVKNPVASLELRAGRDTARTGDVVAFTAVARDARGAEVENVPVELSVNATPGYPVTYQQELERWRADSVERPIVPLAPAAEIDQRGRFVASKPGEFTVLAVAPGQVARQGITVVPRQLAGVVDLVGHGAVRHVETSDIWVWEGVDGRDYAVTGTRNGNGVAYFWDVTDPATPTLTDSVVVDARTVNAVKVSENKRTAVISREGASTRRNGIVILDVTDPRRVRIVAEYDDRLTGGVHSLFIYRDHVYAVNNLRRLDVINIENPARPYRTGVFELETPAHVLHDVWVVDGIAYVSYLYDGVVLLDVGNGMTGGSPSRPVRVAGYKYPVDINGETQFAAPAHATFPYRSPTGRFYVLVGDESYRIRKGNLPGSPPIEAAGYVHVIDFTDLKKPEEVARYEIPEAGSHNFWIAGDTLYLTYYNAGLRVVDLSGELKGNLYEQGREIAKYLPYDKDGLFANAPFTKVAQPYKGHIFLADVYSGLWAVRLRSQPRLTP